MVPVTSFCVGLYFLVEHRIKLLIVDDETRFLNAIAKRLTRRGFDVVDGGEVLRVLKEAYQARLERKFAADQSKMDKILALAEGESPLGILRKLGELDDSRK